MAYGSLAVDSITNSDGFVLGGSGASMKNRIINGGMVIDQRNAGASTTPTNTSSAVYCLDRWATYGSVASKFSVQQNAGSVTPPAGFTNYLGITSLSAYSPSSGDQIFLQQYIEGYNVADLAWGTANAKTITISFWVRSSLTGTFGGALENGSGNRSYAFTYTINSANTWEQKSITITGDTTGTWLTTNGTGIQCYWNLGCGSTFSKTAGSWGTGNVQNATGSVSVVATNGATFYITGVQLEVGSQATSFDYRQYGTELNLCKRYCNIIAFGDDQAIPANWSFNGSTEVQADFLVSPPMRAKPTATQTATQYRGNSASLNNNTTSPIVISATESSVNSVRLSLAGFTGATGGQGAIIRIYSSGASTYFGLTAEL